MIRWIDDPSCRACGRITRERAGSFHLGLQLLPQPMRTAMFVIYAWMRHADDLVDDQAPTTDTSERLDAFASDTAAVFDGEVPEEGLLRALALTHQAFELPRGPFEEMIEGQRRDLSDAPIENEAQLESYCQQVASSVGVLCVHVWGARDPHAHELARLRGVAFQLTNILRDIGEDLQRGRCYLPVSSIKSSVGRDALAAWHPPEPCSELVIKWCGRARECYQASAGLESMIDRRCRGTLVAMTNIYKGILGQIEAKPARSVLGPRAGLSSLAKSWIAARAVLLNR
ncbi:MAG: phytoene/squalene synthase family protein [Phycisphaerales bacterium]|nr:phytoene/squalene synthase family protein [Phycisphaerales bacterium]